MPESSSWVINTKSPEEKDTPKSVLPPITPVDPKTVHNDFVVPVKEPLNIPLKKMLVGLLALICAIGGIYILIATLFLNK